MLKYYVNHIQNHFGIIHLFTYCGNFRIPSNTSEIDLAGGHAAKNHIFLKNWIHNIKNEISKTTIKIHSQLLQATSIKLNNIFILCPIYQNERTFVRILVSLRIKCIYFFLIRYALIKMVPCFKIKKWIRSVFLHSILWLHNDSLSSE